MNKSVSKMSKNEKKKEEPEKLDYKQLYEELKSKIEALPEALTYWATRIGSPCRIVRRDYKDFVGTFLGFGVDTMFLDVGCIEESKNYITNTIRRETKIIRIPMNNLANIEWLIDVVETPEPEKK